MSWNYVEGNSTFSTSQIWVQKRFLEQKVGPYWVASPTRSKLTSAFCNYFAFSILVLFISWRDKTVTNSFDYCQLSLFSTKANLIRVSTCMSSMKTLILASSLLKVILSNCSVPNYLGIFEYFENVTTRYVSIIPNGQLFHSGARQNFKIAACS